MKFILLIVLIAAVTALKKSYEGYKVYKVNPNSIGQVAVLHSVEISGMGEFWENDIAVGKTVRLMVSNEKQDEFVSLIKSSGIEAPVVIADLQEAIENQLKPATLASRSDVETFHSMTWDRYYSYDEINNWLEELQSNYPHIIEVVVWGRSTENREIKGIVIDYNRERHDPIGVIEGTLHAREWISPATVTWIIKEFLTSDDPEVRRMAENFEWHILPVANPDGYVYTFTDNRMWRKNRNAAYNTTCVEGINNDMSNGVDLNRNFGYQWMEVGASNDPCTNTFAGSAAFSEAETRSIVNYLQGLKDDSEGQIIYYLAFHSYTQLVVVPYSHVSSADEMVAMNVNYADMFEIGSRAASQLERRFGTQYRVGISADVLYPMSGTSFDWVKHDIEVPVCYLIELRDVGEFGFLLPAEQIIPNNMEIMDFIKEMDRATRDLGYYTSGVASVLYSLTVIISGIMFVMLS